MRRLVGVLSAVASLVLVLLLGAGWYFASQLTAPPTIRPFEPDTEVLAVDEGSVTLALTPDLATGGRFGLQLPDGGHLALGDPVEVGGDRAVYAIAGDPTSTPAVGTLGRVDEYWRDGAPDDIGVSYEDVVVEGPDGALPAWWVPSGDAGTIVYVHGRGATRAEGLRFLEGIADAGWSTLVVTYRGDEGAPAPAGDRLRYGTDEWADVDAALAWVADERGADEPIVLFGSSLGGAVVGQVIARSDRADDLAGVVLDSPVVSLDTTLDLQADFAGVPEVVQPVLLPIAQLWADVLYDLESGTLERTGPEAFDLPVLLFHGAADDFVPVAQSVELAEDEDVTYVPVDAARHVRSWNVDSAGYESSLAAFLSRRG